MHAMKSHALCADVMSVMEQTPPNTTQAAREPKHDADRIAVSAQTSCANRGASSYGGRSRRR